MSVTILIHGSPMFYYWDQSPNIGFVQFSVFILVDVQLNHVNSVEYLHGYLLTDFGDFGINFSFLNLEYIGIDFPILNDKIPFSKHWNQRRAEDSKSTTVSGSNLSTVGVDIGTFQIGKGVSLSTWDFGGQVKLSWNCGYCTCITALHFSFSLLSPHAPT